MTSKSVRPRRFAPLDPAKQKEGDDRQALKGIVFDVDGTLCTDDPTKADFDAYR